MERSLENKVVLLTGCASGIGAATVPVLLREPAVVAATDIDQNRGENLVRKLVELHPNRVTFQAHDVTDENHGSRPSVSRKPLLLIGVGSRRRSAS